MAAGTAQQKLQISPAIDIMLGRALGIRCPTRSACASIAAIGAPFRVVAQSARTAPPAASPRFDGSARRHPVRHRCCFAGGRYSWQRRTRSAALSGPPDPTGPPRDRRSEGQQSQIDEAVDGVRQLGHASSQKAINHENTARRHSSTHATQACSVSSDVAPTGNDGSRTSKIRSASAIRLSPRLRKRTASGMTRKCGLFSRAKWRRADANCDAGLRSVTTITARGRTRRIQPRPSERQNFNTGCRPRLVAWSSNCAR